MRHRRLTFAVLAAVVLALLVFVGVRYPRVDARFATSGYVRYHYAGKSIDRKLDDDDLAAIKNMLVGHLIWDPGSICGFLSDVSIRLTDGHKSITFCPACNGCEMFGIGDSDWYLRVSKEQRARFNAIVKKYGMTFPCI